MFPFWPISELKKSWGMKLASLDTISAIPVCCDPSTCLEETWTSSPILQEALPVLICDISSQTSWLTCCTAPGLVPSLLSLLSLSGFYTLHFFLPILSPQRLAHGTEDYKGVHGRMIRACDGNIRLGVEVFREGPCVTCAGSMCFLCCISARHCMVLR